MFRSLRPLLIAAALLLPGMLSAAVPPHSPQKPERGSLQGQLLIAAPGMSDPRFAQAVLVMVRHNRDGAMGIMINRPLGEQPIARLLAAMGEDSADARASVPIYLGGPVQPGLGFVLHSSDYRTDGTLDIDGRIALTASKEVFRSIAAGIGPKKSLIAFGYAGWSPGQIENEMVMSAWYTAPIDLRLVFDEERSKVWKRAIAQRTQDL